MSLQQFSDAQLMQDLKEMETLISKTPSADRRKIYEQTARTIRAEQVRRGQLSAKAATKPAEVQKPAANPISVKMPVDNPTIPVLPHHQKQRTEAHFSHTETHEEPAKYAKYAIPEDGRIGASIRVPMATDPHNPSIKLDFEDGYTWEGHETDCRNRFVSSLRDTEGLRCVENGRIERIWRWSSAWRAVGFYQGLTYFYGKAPTLSDLGLKNPSNRRREIFQLIFDKAYGKGE